MSWNIDNTNKYFKPDTRWMSEKYDEMNALLFNGSLGDCDFAIFTTGKGSQGRTLGFLKFQRKKVKVHQYTRRMYVENNYYNIEINRTNFVELCQPQIALNGNYTGTEYAFLNTLVHEMCHYYTYMNGIAPVQAHGVEFRNIGSFICNKSDGFFNIQRLASAEEMDNYILSDEMKEKKLKREENKKSNINAVFVFKLNGEIQLTTTSNQNLINKICEQNKHKNSFDKIVISNDMKLINFLFEKGYKVNFRTWRYWDISNENWINILDDMNINIIKNSDKSVNESKKHLHTNEIINEVLNKYLESKFNENFIEINPDMNLGIQSPFDNL